MEQNYAGGGKMNKTSIGVIFGGRSGEHDVSLKSAASIMEAIDRKKYEIVPIGITREGRWIAGNNPWKALQEGCPEEDCFRAVPVTDPCNPGILLLEEEQGEMKTRHFIALEVVFPVLHGPFGEDGTVQGLLELCGLPYVGSGVAGSAAGMDKVLMKQLFLQNCLPVGEFVYFKHWDWLENPEAWKGRVKEEVSYPCFVKPANLGSSVGISKVYYEKDLGGALEEAFKYDEKVVVEANIPGREIECSVLGDEKVEASLPGEVVPCNDFYDYKAKYIDDRSELVIPAELSQDLKEKVQEYSISAFKALEASGLGRADFFVDEKSGRIIVNEINTLPGFTAISMYPKLWEATGVSYVELVERLIQLAVKRYRRKSRLSTEPPV